MSSYRVRRTRRQGSTGSRHPAPAVAHARIPAYTTGMDRDITGSKDTASRVDKLEGGWEDGPDGLSQRKDGGGVWWSDDADPLDDQHLALLFHHPGFLKQVENLREDLELGARVDLPALLGELRSTDGKAVNPLVAEVARRYGIAPVDLAAYLAFPSDRKYLARERSAIFVEEREFDWVIRIPRPFHQHRKRLLERWIARAGAERTAFETPLFGKSAKLAEAPSLIDVLGDFDEWNDRRKEPMQLWRARLDAGERIDSDAFVQTLIRLWQRMRAIDPNGIRDDRPSKASA